jgi:hypothetical protein
LGGAALQRCDNALATNAGFSPRGTHVRIRTVCTAILLTLASSGLLGQTAAPSEAPASHDDILKLFDVMQIRSQMKLVMQQVSEQMKSTGHEQVRRMDPNVTDKEIAKLDAISDKVLKEVPVEGLLDDMIPVYQKHLSKPDVDAMIGFYSTPTGQKILREMPAITTEGMQAVQPRLRQVIDETNEKIEKMIRDQMEGQQQKVTPPPNAVKD